MFLRIRTVRSNIHHTDPIVCVQYGDGIARTDRQPLFQITSCMIEYGLQYKGRQSEIIDAIHATSNFDLPAKIGMDFDEHFHPQRPSLLSKSLYKCKGLRDHETTASGFFDGISNGIQPHHTNVILVQRLQHRLKISLTLWMIYIDINLLVGK